MHCFNVSCNLGGGEGECHEGEGWEALEGGWGRLGTLGGGGSEGVTQTGDQGLSVISCSKYIDKLDGQTMRCEEELCETLL